MAQRHFLKIEDFDQKTITSLLDRAENLLKTIVEKNDSLNILSGQILTNLFFEPSTRTSQSFIIAGNRLGAITLSPLMSHSSTVKGESLRDTVFTFAAMGTRILVLRHFVNHIPEQVAYMLKGMKIAVINGGDGTHQHPTQTLIDLLTIRQHKGDFSNLIVAIIGDVAHSRVAKSLIIGLFCMGVREIRLIAPHGFLPNDLVEFSSRYNVKIYTSLADGLVATDVIVALRIQRERMNKCDIFDSECFFSEYGLDEARLALAKPNVIVLHPGPINRGVEISDSVADGPHSVILQQVKNGIAIRMAIMEWLVT